jgi:threonine dehydrogenase-like Zn-dependent dehydrogenase
MRTIYFEKNIPKIMLTAALRPIWPNVVFSRMAPTRMANIPEKSLPGPGWVRVDNRMCGICASDLHLVFIEADPRVSPAALPDFDRLYLGHEILGEVTEIGQDVNSLQVGDRVIMDYLEANCVATGIEPRCRHCQYGNYYLCENAFEEHGPEEWGGRKISTYDLTAELLLNGKLNTDGFITHRYPLEHWREAVQTAGNKTRGAIKVVLDYRQDF